MLQLEEDEWPSDGQTTTTESQPLKDDEPTAPSGTRSDYPPQLPPEATPTTDDGVAERPATS